MPLSVFEFGGFRLDCGRFELSREGRRLRLERKPMELLILLASRNGQLVARDEISKRLWSSEVFVDTDHGINTAVRKIREVLRDDPQEPRFIQTVPAMGYRFVASIQTILTHQSNQPESTSDTAPEVSKAHDSALPAPHIPFAPPSKLVRRKPWVAVALSSGFLVLVLVAAFWYLRRPLPPLQVSEYARITHDGFPKCLIGTDGSRLYFNRSFPGDIAQTAITNDAIAAIPLQLPGTELEDVSPDGSNLLVISDDHGHQSLWTAEMPGGSVRRLADSAAWSAAWSPDGRSAIYSTPDREIYVVSRDGTGTRKLSGWDDDIAKSNIDNLAWSPDGSKIRFTRDERIWEMSPDGSDLRLFLPDWQPSAQLCCGRWTPDGKLFVFLLHDPLANPDIPRGQLWVLDEHRDLLRGPSDPVQLASGPILWATPIPSQDGKKVFARGIISRGELDRHDAHSHRMQPWLGGISAEYVTFSPDGKSVAYVTFPQGVLWKANRDGSNPVQLTGPPFYPLNPKWSPDGSRILFFCGTAAAKVKIFTIASQGGNPQLLLPEDKNEQIDPNWSPDGRKVIFSWPVWARGNTHNVIRVLDLPTHQVETLPGSQGMWSARWSPNGRFILGMDPGGGITVFNCETRQWSSIVAGEIDYPTWSSDSKFIYFLRSFTGPPGVYRVRVSGGAPERVVDLKGFRFTGALSVWMGLDPNDVPLVMRDTGSDDIYALTLQQK